MVKFLSILMVKLPFPVSPLKSNVSYIVPVDIILTVMSLSIIGVLSRHSLSS